MDDFPTDSLLEEFKNIEESFVFLFVGHWLQGDMGQDRKDVGMLIKTFLETFKNQKKQPCRNILGRVPFGQNNC